MENKKYEKALIQQANLENNFYNYTTTLQPCAYFWKQLVKGKQTPELLVPDTLLLNDKQSPLIWIYTNTHGKLQKSTNINLKDFINKITNYCSPNQLAACLKRVTFNQNYINGNDIKLLNARYLQNASFTQLGGQGQSIITIQRYIKSNGNNPFICRTIWRRDKHSECFIITSKKSYYDQNQPEIKRFLVKVGESQKSETPSIVKAIQGKHLTQTGHYLSNITTFMKVYRGIDISQIVGDFIKDQAGNWWLINIKAFQVDSKRITTPQSIVHNLNTEEQVLQQGISQGYQKQKYQKTKICRYCQKSYLQSQLTHYMTIKMLIETDRYLLHLGKNYKWLRRSDIMNVDTHCLYQEHKICQRCYRLYMQIQQLMEVQNEFLKSMGFVMEKKPKQLLMSLTNEEQLKTQSKNKQLQSLASCFQNSHKKPHSQNNHDNLINKSSSQIAPFPKTIQLGPNSNIIFDDNNVPVKNDHMINKMIRYRLILYLKQLDQLQLPPFLHNQQFLNYNFFIQYQLFDIKNRIKLDFLNHFNPDKRTLQIKKLKINYFFSHSPYDVHEYLNSLQQDFYIKIYAEHKNLKNRKFDNITSKTLSIKMKTSSKFSNADNQSLMDRNPNKRKTEKKNTLLKTFGNQFISRTILGKLSLSVNQFLSNMLGSNGNKICKKDFYKFFSVNQVPHGWGLQGSIGIIPSQSYVNTSRMIFFTQDNLIYLPSDNYYYCQHLPQQWIDVMRKQLGENHRSSSGFGIDYYSKSIRVTNDYVKQEVYVNEQQQKKNQKDNMINGDECEMNDEILEDIGKTDTVKYNDTQLLEQQHQQQDNNNNKIYQQGDSLNFKQQVKLLLNQHSLSSYSYNQSLVEAYHKNESHNNQTEHIKIQNRSEVQSNDESSLPSKNQFDFTKTSWKSLLKDQISTYEKKAIRFDNKKKLLDKKTSKTKLY